MDHFVSLGREANEQQRRQSFYILLYILLYIYIRVNKHTLMEAVQNYTRFDTPKTFCITGSGSAARLPCVHHWTGKGPIDLQVIGPGIVMLTLDRETISLDARIKQ